MPLQIAVISFNLSQQQRQQQQMLPLASQRGPKLFSFATLALVFVFTG